jgi:hypothetical protein
LKESKRPFVFVLRKSVPPPWSHIIATIVWKSEEGNSSPTNGAVHQESYTAWGEGNARVLKEDEGDLVRQRGALAKSDGICLGMSLWSWHFEATPPIEIRSHFSSPTAVLLGNTSKRTRAERRRLDVNHQ